MKESGPSDLTGAAWVRRFEATFLNATGARFSIVLTADNKEPGVAGAAQADDDQGGGSSRVAKKPSLSAKDFQTAANLLNRLANWLASGANEEARVAGTGNDSIAVHKAKQYVASHLQEELTLNLVAQHVHVSRFYFCKLFKKSTGRTLTEYVARARLDRAKSLLADSSVRVSEAAYAAGFGSIPRFNSVFKRALGMSPTAYRTTLRTPVLTGESNWR